jgi:hypothetical protein
MLMSGPKEARSMTHPRTVATIALAVFSVVSPSAAQDPHAQMNARGAQAMGFDQDRTAHHFYLYTNGGAIDVSVKDEADTANRDAIRSHLPHIAMMFGQGDLSAPMLVHGANVPGTADMARLKGDIAYAYHETPRGGRVDITTTDTSALRAIHEFLRYQIAEHKTGDSLDVKKR